MYILSDLTSVVHMEQIFYTVNVRPNSDLLLRIARVLMCIIWLCINSCSHIPRAYFNPLFSFEEFLDY